MAIIPGGPGDPGPGYRNFPVFKIGDKVSVNGKMGVVATGGTPDMPGVYNFVVAFKDGNSGAFSDQELNFISRDEIPIPPERVSETLLTTTPGDYPDIKDVFFKKKPTKEQIERTRREISEARRRGAIGGPSARIERVALAEGKMIDEGARIRGIRGEIPLSRVKGLTFTPAPGKQLTIGKTIFQVTKRGTLRPIASAKQPKKIKIDLTAGTEPVPRMKFRLPGGRIGIKDVSLTSIPQTTIINAVPRRGILSPKRDVLEEALFAKRIFSPTFLEEIAEGVPKIEFNESNFKPSLLKPVEEIVKIKPGPIAGLPTIQVLSKRGVEDINLDFYKKQEKQQEEREKEFIKDVIEAPRKAIQEVITLPDIIVTAPKQLLRGLYSLEKTAKDADVRANIVKGISSRPITFAATTAAGVFIPIPLGASAVKAAGRAGRIIKPGREIIEAARIAGPGLGKTAKGLIIEPAKTITKLKEAKFSLNAVIPEIPKPKINIFSVTTESRATQKKIGGKQITAVKISSAAKIPEVKFVSGQTRLTKKLTIEPIPHTEVKIPAQTIAEVDAEVILKPLKKGKIHKGELRQVTKTPQKTKTKIESITLIKEGEKFAVGSAGFETKTIKQMQKRLLVSGKNAENTLRLVKVKTAILGKSQKKFPQPFRLTGRTNEKAIPRVKKPKSEFIAAGQTVEEIRLGKELIRRVEAKVASVNVENIKIPKGIQQPVSIFTKPIHKTPKRGRPVGKNILAKSDIRDIQVALEQKVISEIPLKLKKTSLPKLTETFVPAKRPPISRPERIKTLPSAATIRKTFRNQPPIIEEEEFISTIPIKNVDTSLSLRQVQIEKQGQLHPQSQKEIQGRSFKELLALRQTQIPAQNIIQKPIQLQIQKPILDIVQKPIQLQKQKPIQLQIDMPEVPFVPPHESAVAENPPREPHPPAIVLIPIILPEYKTKKRKLKNKKFGTKILVHKIPEVGKAIKNIKLPKV